MAANAHDAVLCTVEDGVATFCLKMPKALNAMSVVSGAVRSPAASAAISMSPSPASPISSRGWCIRLACRLIGAVRSAYFIAWRSERGLEALPTAPADFARFMLAQRQRSSNPVRAAWIRLD